MIEYMIEYISSFNNIKRIDSVSSVVREGKSSDTLLDLLLDNGPRVQDRRIPWKWMRREVFKNTVLGLSLAFWVLSA